MLANEIRNGEWGGRIINVMCNSLATARLQTDCKKVTFTYKLQTNFDDNLKY